MSDDESLLLALRYRDYSGFIRGSQFLQGTSSSLERVCFSISPSFDTFLINTAQIYIHQIIVTAQAYVYGNGYSINCNYGLAIKVTDLQTGDWVKDITLFSGVLGSTGYHNCLYPGNESLVIPIKRSFKLDPRLYKYCFVLGNAFNVNDKNTSGYDYRFVHRYNIWLQENVSADD